jgi:hypothetical protein
LIEGTSSWSRRLGRFIEKRYERIARGMRCGGVCGNMASGGKLESEAIRYRMARRKVQEERLHVIIWIDCANNTQQMRRT